MEVKLFFHVIIAMNNKKHTKVDKNKTNNMLYILQQRGEGQGEGREKWAGITGHDFCGLITLTELYKHEFGTLCALCCMCSISRRIMANGCTNP